MDLVKRLILVTMILVLPAPIALAGPNAGGVLVLHDPGLAFTLDTVSHVGLSGVACGQDGPPFPAVYECPPYDPIGGANPCNPEAANPTSTMAAGVPHVWYVMAAFPAGSCPRLKTVGFRINYDPLKVRVDPTRNGPGAPDSEVFFQGTSSTESGDPFPSDRSGMGLSFVADGSTVPPFKTSLLQEIWWFAGYAYVDATDATFGLEALRDSENFGDDQVPAQLDEIAGYGRLGLGGTSGFNPTPQANTPVEATSWSRIKATYRPN